MSLMASLVTTNRMQQWFNVLTDIYHELLLLFHFCIVLKIKFSITTTTTKTWTKLFLWLKNVAFVFHFYYRSLIKYLNTYNSSGNGLVMNRWHHITFQFHWNHMVSLSKNNLTVLKEYLVIPHETWDIEAVSQIKLMVEYCLFNAIKCKQHHFMVVRYLT